MINKIKFTIDGMSFIFFSCTTFSDA